MEKTRILMVCGEASGDLNAAVLARALHKLDPSIELSGVGGGLLKHEGVTIFSDIKELAVMGFFDVLLKLPRFLRLKKLIMQKIVSDKPNAIILVDFSGFNLRLAKAINKSIPVIYYISPQVWASRSGRIKTIRKYISKIIVLFKFEQEFYAQHGIEAIFLGHPLLDTVWPTQSKETFLAHCNLSGSRTTIALLPGSRKQEISLVLPPMLEAAKLIQKQMPRTQFIIAGSPHVDPQIYYRHIRSCDREIKIIENKTYDCINLADFCLVCSGTATLETAILQKPFCVIYKTSALNYELYRRLIKVPYIGMVNIVAKKLVVPEFIQYEARGENIARYVLRMLQDPEAIETMRNELSAIKSSLGEKGAGLRAAKTILEYLRPS